MKIKRINTAILLLALASMTLVGCGNEDIANVTPKEEGTGNVSFSIVEKDYEPADDTPKSRAAIEETKPEIQDLGDGLIAEVSLVPDTTHRVEYPKTRAINTPTHYTIQAYQGGVKKGELKGTFNGSTFTPDTGQPKSISLPHGTYDFVCFNDKVTANGTQFTVNRSDAATARFTVQRGVLINQDPKQQVAFTMKHAGARIYVNGLFMNFVINTKVSNIQYIDEDGSAIYKADFDNPLEKFKYKLETPASTLPETLTYDISTDTYSYPSMGKISESGEAKGSSLVAYSTPGSPLYLGGNRFMSDYWLPTTDCSNLKLTFTYGEVYGCNLVGKSITIPEHKQVEANKMYTIMIRLYLTNIYMYSDGSVGPLNKNSGKIPIAVVFDTSKHLSVALHDVNEGGLEQIQWNNSISRESSNPATSYSEFFSSGVYGNVNTLNTAIQAARDYIPSSPNWRIPQLYTFLNMGKCLGRMLDDGKAYFSYLLSGYQYNFLSPSGAAAIGFTPAPSSVNFPAMDMTRFNDAFTKVGGTPPSGTYWINAECKDGTEYKMATITISSDGKFHLGLKSKTETAKVRPFIFY